MSTLETSTEAALRERLEATERLIEDAREGQRMAHRMLEQTLEQNRVLQEDVHRLTVMVEGLQGQLEELLRAKGLPIQRPRKPRADKPSKLKPPPPRPKKTGGKRKPRREPLPEHLERDVEQVPIEHCAACSSSDVEQREPEVVEKLEYIRAHLRVRRLELGVVGCNCCDTVSTAPLPPLAVPKGNMGATMLSWLAYAKCGLHMPLARIAQDLEHQGVTFASSTLCDAIGHVAWLLEPIYDRLVAMLFAYDLLQLDGTGIKVLQPGEKGTHRGQFAVWCNHEISVYQFTVSKHGEHLAEFLGIGGERQYVGYLVADAASNMNVLYANGLIVECGCWFHARSKFAAARESAPTKAEEGIAWIAALFEAEKVSAELGETAEQRLARRKRDTVPLLRQFEDWLEETQPMFEPDEDMYKAVQYCKNHKDALHRFLDDGRIPMTNNLSERELGIIGRGRKNYLFAGSDEGAKRLATLYTIVRTCQRLGIDPYAYLCDVLPRLSTLPVNREPGLLGRLTPQAWKAANSLVL